MLTQERVKQLLHYNPETGIFTWLSYRSRRAKKGDIAGTLKDGRVELMIDRKHYKAHRLAWMYVHGHWPVNQIDHINTIPNDNRLVNLREASHSENQQNIRNAQSNNKLGVLGVSKFRNKYQASIKLNGIQYHLGHFSNIDDAKSAYDAKKRELHKFSTI